MIRFSLPTALAAALVWTAAPANTNTVNAIKDNTLIENAAGALSLGGAQYFFIGRTQQVAGTSIRRGMVRFDLAGNLPAGSIITSVSLRLNCSKYRSSTARPVTLRRLLRDWGEGTAGLNSTGAAGDPSGVGDATWIHTAYDTMLWSSPGASGNDSDRSSLVSATQNVGATGAYTWTSTTSGNAQMVADVQSWLDSPASNFGWLVTGDETTTGTAKRMDSQTNAALANRPSLTVTFTAPNSNPVVTFLGPTSAATYGTGLVVTTLAISGTASDDVGVTQVTWSNDRGGSGTATGTTNWSVAAVPLMPGVNVLTVTARDALGNMGSHTLTVTNADTNPPIVVITAPTSNPTFATNFSPMTMAGTASDNVGVTQVSWSNDRGQGGAAVGTTSWSVSNIPLAVGPTLFTVSALDAAGNVGTRSVRVTYDNVRPTVTITSPTTQPIYYTSAAQVTIGGTAMDDNGIDTIFWENNRGGSGAATGTTSWTAANIPLQPGANNITISAFDAATNMGTAILSVNRDNTPPVVTITAPTSDPTYAASSSPIMLAGTASDATGITSVTWTNDRGGSGTASGTFNWSIPAVALQPGQNVIVVTARDGANNPGTDTLTVTYTAGSPPVIAAIPDGSAACGAPYTMDVPLVSGDPPITWTLVTGPAGMQIGAASGALSWPDPMTNANAYTISVRAANAAGSDTRSWRLAVLPGDFDGDGRLTAADAALLAAHLLGVDASKVCAADVNMDAQVDAADIQAFINRQ